MSNLHFKFIGWCNKVECDGSKHDKIWGYFSPTDDHEPYQKVYVFWGARGKKNTIHFKADVFDYNLGKLTDKKKDKGYRSINEAKLLEIWPTFYNDVEMKLCFDVLANKVR